MNKLVLAASVAAVLASVSMAQAAQTGTITFEGELTANTCDVAVAGQGADATVKLPTLSTSQITGATTTGGVTGFTMALTNCEGTLKTASAFFEAGGDVDPVTGRLKNSLEGEDESATNVDLQLLDSSNGDVTIQAGNANQKLTLTSGNAGVSIESGSATLPYAVQYYATGTTTPGLVKSSVVYSIQYN